MPETSPRVAIDAHPRLAGVMDTINASDAHGPATKLPPELQSTLTPVLPE